MYYDEDMFGGGHGHGGFPGGFGGGQRRSRGPVKDETITKEFFCTLEELYSGCQKKLKIKKSKYDARGRLLNSEEKVISIDVKKGWKPGTKVTFPNEGDEHENRLPADICFVLQQKPHDLFKREGNDIHYTHKLSLKEALATDLKVIEFNHLDGKKMTVDVSKAGLITPDFTQVLANQGFPVKNTTNQFGNLVIAFQYVFPEKLNEEQKKLIHDALSMEDENDAIEKQQRQRELNEDPLAKFARQFYSPSMNQSRASPTTSTTSTTSTNTQEPPSPRTQRYDIPMENEEDEEQDFEEDR